MAPIGELSAPRRWIGKVPICRFRHGKTIQITLFRAISGQFGIISQCSGFSGPEYVSVKRNKTGNCKTSRNFNGKWQGHLSMLNLHKWTKCKRAKTRNTPYFVCLIIFLYISILQFTHHKMHIMTDDWGIKKPIHGINALVTCHGNFAWFYDCPTCFVSHWRIRDPKQL